MEQEPQLVPVDVDPDQLCVCGATDSEHDRDRRGRLICPDAGEDDAA